MIGLVILLAVVFGAGLAAIVGTLAEATGRTADEAEVGGVDGTAGRPHPASGGDPFRPMTFIRRRSAAGPGGEPGRWSGRSVARDRVPVAGGIALTIIVFLVTRWPAAVALGVAASFGVPQLLRQLATSTRSDRIEAVATWTELLEGTMAASAGLMQALVATAPLAPDAIRPAATHLAARLEAGASTRTALLEFASEIDDPAADRVICALLMASGTRAQRLGDLLGALAAATRDDVAMRLRIEASRTSVVSGARTVVMFSIAFATGLVVLAHSYLAPFGTETGQAMLVIVGLLYASGLALMVSIAAPKRSMRLLGASPGGAG